MPVTAKLSKAFYERFGEDIANQLVEWFNQVDATYRADLRELNELNYARFDAKLEQRMAELHGVFDAGLTEVNAKTEVRLAEQTALLRHEIRQEIRGIEKYVDAARADLIKWTFVFWATTALVVIGMMTRFM